jgi:hypothetical protein
MKNDKKQRNYKLASFELLEQIIDLLSYPTFITRKDLKEKSIFQIFISFLIYMVGLYVLIKIMVK